MAPKASGSLNSGGELVRGAFRSASEEFRNVIMMLDVAGLSFILEEPTKVLEQDVLEFYQNAKISGQGKKIKSSIRSCKVILKASGINRSLKMPVVESEELSVEDTFRARSFCGILDQSAKIRRKFMNEGGKLLCDIIGKVFLCKVGSHDYISEDDFKIHTAIICQKNLNFGEVIFEKIKESFLAPNFGRILSLLLHSANPEFFNTGRGTPIHHTKKINSSIFTKWERVIPKGLGNAAGRAPLSDDVAPLPDVLKSNEAGQSSRGSGLDPTPAQDRDAHVEGELPTPRDIGACSGAAEVAPPSVADLVLKDQEVAAVVVEASQLEDSRRSPALVDSQPEDHDILPDTPPEQSDSGEQGSLGAMLRLAKEMSLLEGEKVQEDPFMAESVPSEVLPPLLLLPPPEIVVARSTSPRATVLDSLARSSSFVAEKLSPEEGETGDSSHSSLLKSIAGMLQSQTDHFDKSIKQVYKKIDSVDSSLRQDMAEIKHDMGRFKTDQEAWMLSAGKALDHTNKAVGHALQNLHQVSKDVLHQTSAITSLSTAHDQGISYLDDQVENQLKRLYNLLHEDVIKGEESVVSKLEVSASKLDELNENVASQMKDLKENILQNVKDVNWYTHEAQSWLFKQVAEMLGFTVVDKGSSIPSSSAPGPRAPSFSQHSAEDSVFADEVFPASSYQDMWDDPALVQDPDSPHFADPSEKSLKRKLFDDKPHAKKSNPFKKAREFYDRPPPRNFQESWSPISKDIILSVFDKVSNQNEKVSDHYSSEEWSKFEKRTTERRIHFKNGGSKESAPDKYWPKPKAFFERMDSELKKKSEAVDRMAAKMKGKGHD